MQHFQMTSTEGVPYFLGKLVSVTVCPHIILHTLLMQGLAPPGRLVHSYKWLLDCVGGMEVRPIEPYRLEVE